MEELNVVMNLMERKRFLGYTLIGHTKMIACLDLNSHGMVVSGGYDNTVKVWDVQKKKGWSFD